jgi:leader peptidase (prepilin peptidase)/N-methyltransferase
MAIIFAFGCCLGSFLNVVILRIPEGKSIITPPSSCPKCGKRIKFYDNIPLISWIILGGKCRNCRTRISPQYFIIELLTGALFTYLFYVYFISSLRSGLEINSGGWFVYLLHLVLIGGLIASSVIDLKLWIIPVSICWFISIIGAAASGLGCFFIEPARISQYHLLPNVTADTAALAVGGIIGLVISVVLLVSGFIKRSYEYENTTDSEQFQPGEEPDPADENFNHRLEALKEIVFLLPVMLCSAGFYILVKNTDFLGKWWFELLQNPVISGFMGSLWGYLIGCGIVWATRIFGTLGFGKEAMGLGDVYLMGAAGAVLGGEFAVVAFFIAPFFGLLWAFFQMFSKKIHQIPYGPFLSFGIFAVMILHNWILSYFGFTIYH